MQVNSINTINETSFGHRNKRKNGGIGKAVASNIVPGLGQFIDGRNGAGTFFMMGVYGLFAGAVALGYSVYKDLNKETKPLWKNLNALDKKLENATRANKKNIKDQMAKLYEKIGQRNGKALTSNKTFGVVALIGTAFVLQIADLVDAYKGKRIPVVTEKKHHKCLNCN